MTQRRTTTFLIVTVAAISLASLCLSLWLMNREKKIGYIDTIRLFNDYALKKDMEAREEPVLNRIKSSADSMKAVYDAMSQNGNKDQLKQLEMQIVQASAVFRQENERSNRDINEKVWKRLNPDIDEFARSIHIDLLIGANGMGTVLYGNKGTDYTDDLLSYVNKKYNHGN